MLVNELDDYNLEDLHDMMVRNGYYLPTKSCHWMTKKVMLSMIMGQTYCPKYKDIKVKTCPKRPYRIILVTEINKEIESQISSEKELVYTSTRLPDLNWLLTVLSTLNPNHKFFQKSYNPEKNNDPNMLMKLE